MSGGISIPGTGKSYVAIYVNAEQTGDTTFCKI